MENEGGERKRTQKRGTEVGILKEKNKNNNSKAAKD